MQLMQDGDTALHIAAQRDYNHIISILLKYNANENIRNFVRDCFILLYSHMLLSVYGLMPHGSS